MRFNLVSGVSARGRELRGNWFCGPLSWFALACAAALITTGPGCGGGGTPLSTDAGSGGHVGTGGATPGTGGASMGGSGMGGAGVGGAMDASLDVDMTCADASFEGGSGDSDGDGVPDCLDGCPTDILKQAPGVCGCGVVDTDSDGDGVDDCIDKCPGIADSIGTLDSDGDGTIDCQDGCPHDATRTAPGVCGCGGIPESTPLCLVHRYSFDDTTTTIADSITIPGVSPKNGVGSTAAVVPSGGKLTLAGGAASSVTTGQWVTLPAGTISTLGPNATFEAWVGWNPPVATQWQRIFDFGNSTGATGTPANGQTYIFLSPENGQNNFVRAAITLASNGGNEDIADGTSALPIGASPLVHVAVVVDDANLSMTLYVNGQPVATPPATLRGHNILTQLQDVNNWLGRSQWAPDTLFGGVYEEFRIYAKALSPAQIAANFTAGPNTIAPAVPPDAGTATDAAPDAPANPDGGTDAPAGQ